MLYPLKFKPIFKNYIWGGNNLKKFGKQFDENETVAESWELSSHPDGDVEVINGELQGTSLSSLVNRFGSKLLGDKYDINNPSRFPLLIKLIDATDKLSVQVHPNDDFAFKYEDGELGKTEMWYVLDAKPNAKLVYGLKPNTTKENFIKAIEKGKIEVLLNEVEVKKGDFFDIPAGVVHAIGDGIIIAEIQQNSNSTYRLYDYNRKDERGNYRELHIDKALKTISFDTNTNKSKHCPSYSSTQDLTITPLVKNEYFDVNKYLLNGTVLENTNTTQFQIYFVIDGNVSFKTVTTTVECEKGDTILIPAEIGNFEIIGNAQLIKATA